MLDMFFLTFLTAGHMLPMVDMARLFAARGVKVTIITTPSNALLFHKAIDQDKQSGLQIQLSMLKFPSVEVGLPEGVENFYSITSLEMAGKLYKAISLLQDRIEQLVRERRPNCIVSDMFYPWTTDLAAQLGIPRLFFDGMGFFSLCVSESMRLNAPHEKVLSDVQAFLVPGLPDPITMARSQLPDYVRNPSTVSSGLMNRIRESKLRSYGVVVNSFYELERDYVQHYKKGLRMKAWHVGPVSLINRETVDKAKRVNGSASVEDCLRWLDSWKPNSVLYVCFGTSPHFPTAQLCEIALGLKESSRPFVWFVREEDKLEWLPEGFNEKVMETKMGLMIKGWAPQVLMLDHPAIGGFLTHCGWNSVLESVSAGVPMITWPVSSEQFYNEKLITEVLRIGIGVGAKDWTLFDQESKELVRREAIETAVTGLMSDVGGEEGKQMRRRAGELRDMAKSCVEEGGSSYADMTALIEDLKQLCFSHPVL